MRAPIPFVPGAESASSKFRIILDRTDRFLQNTEIDTIDVTGLVLCIHYVSPLVR
jgi:hypothetical protein